MSEFPKLGLDPQGTTEMTIDEDTNVTVIQLPNKAIARVYQAGVAALRKDRQRVERRRNQRRARRLNRSK